MTTNPKAAEAMKAKLADRPDLLKRLNEGDTTALVEIIEYTTGTSTGEVTVRLMA